MTSPPSLQPRPTAPTSDEISLLELLTPPVRRWRVILLLPLAFALVAAGVSLLLPAKYRGVTTFSQESVSPAGLSGLVSLAGLAGLAGELGLSPGSGSVQTPDFLASVLESRELLEATLASEFPDPRRPGTRRPLIDLLDIEGETRRERVNKGVRRLNELAETSVDRRTGIVALVLTMRDPHLAASVANRMTALLDQFNLQRRQTQSRQQRRFVGERLEQAQQELREAERQQVRFIERNRRYEESPLLAVEAGRLERNVRLKQEVFLSLTKAYEEARIAEVRDTPSLTIIDSAVPPTTRASPHRKFITLVGLLFGLVVAVGVAYIAEARRSARRAERADYRALADAWNNARTELSAAVRRSAK